jgi:hypothetical protein
MDTIYRADIDTGSVNFAKTTFTDHVRHENSPFLYLRVAPTAKTRYTGYCVPHPTSSSFRCQILLLATYVMAASFARAQEISLPKAPTDSFKRDLALERLGQL